MFTLAFSIYLLNSFHTSLSIACPKPKPRENRLSLAHKHCEKQRKTIPFSSFLTRSLCADSKCTECWVKPHITGPSSLTVLSHFHKHYLLNLDSSSHLSDMLYLGLYASVTAIYVCLFRHLKGLMSFWK